MIRARRPRRSDETSSDLEAVVNRAYWLILGRQADPGGLAHSVELLRQGRLDQTSLCAQLVSSTEFTQRFARSQPRAKLKRGQVPAGGVDVRRLMETYTIEQLLVTAEQYFESNSGSPEYFFAKPLYDVDEAPDHLTCFAQMISVLRPLPGMRVLDFGAGACWTSRALSQLGCEVIALDASVTALELGRQLYERLPPVGTTPAPTFLLFDGHRIDLPDNSVDRILCFDAFHHVPNQAEVLVEWGRVLRDGGVAGLSEPGPRHSITAQSQFEMRNYTVIENDIVMDDVWPLANQAGFSDLRPAIFHTQSYTVPLEVYADFISGGPTAAEGYLEMVREFSATRSNFFLSKGTRARADSRDRRGLAGQLTVSLNRTELGSGEPIAGSFTARNSGDNDWLLTPMPRAQVKLGIHLYSADAELLDRDFARVPLPGDTTIAPGEEAASAFRLPAPPAGRYRLVFDLVSEKVCWFEINGCRPVEVEIEIGAP